MEQFDLEEFAKMFDAALASDNPTVKKALRNFMMVTAIVHAQENNDSDRITCPLETLIKRVETLDRMVRELQYNRTTTAYPKDHYKDYYGTNPTWVYSPNTSTTSATGYYGTSVDKVWTDDLDSTMISQLMKDKIR